MKSCDRSLAVQLLNDQLSDAATAEFEAHIETCSQCRQWLEEEAGGEPSIQYARDLLASSSEMTCWNGVQRKETTQSKTVLDSAILAPSDLPDSMGRIGIYEVSGLVGRGGMGIVYKASDPALDRNVAIKVLDPTLAGLGAARQRFALEARAMASISHEHVVPIFSVDEHQGIPYFAMEYIAGGTLEARLRDSGPLDVLSVLRISRQIALALGAAHECGLVHRDIKPANILLDRGVERVRVADFGLARVNNDASHTRSGFVAGTPQFMSPEQVRGEACTEQSDLFSLGSVMYAMCTGHSPFRSESMYGSMQRIVHDEPRSIVEQFENIPKWLEQFIFKLLEKELPSRFQSAYEVADFLEQEIAAMQNPSVHQVPDRPWCNAARQPKVASHGNRINSMKTMLALTVSFLIVGGALWVSRPVVKDPSDVSSKSPSQSSSTVSKPPFDRSLLWQSDGLNEVQQSVKRLEESLQSNRSTFDFDPFATEILDVKKQLDALERSSL